MRKLRIIISLLLICIMTLSLVSCESKVSEEEAVSLVKKFVEDSYELNEIFYGKGLSYYESVDGEYSSVYSAVKLDEKYTTSKELKDRTREVFSASYANSIIGYVFSLTPGIYGQSKQPRYSESGGYITVLRDYEVIDITEYDYDTVKIKKIKRKEIKATIMSTENEEVEIVLVLEADGWRLDSATV